MVKKTGRFYSSFKNFYENLLKVRGNPREIALGFALGIFIGMSPTMGIQMPIAVFFALIFKWNKISAAMGVWITNPITAPFMYGLTYFVGAKILGLRISEEISDRLDAETFSGILSKAPEILWALIIGGIVLGLPLALLSYYLCYSAVRKYQEELKSKLAEQKAKYQKNIREGLAKQKEKMGMKKEEGPRKKKCNKGA